jgi:hypothetical protein
MSEPSVLLLVFLLGVAAGMAIIAFWNPTK